MKIIRSLICAAVLGLGLVAGTSTASRAEIGYLRVLFTKGGFIVGFGRGRGVLSFRGNQYPFKVSGMSIGATIGASTTELAGRAVNLHSAGDIAGVYSAIGAGGALAAGAGGVALQNARGVILELHGAKIGVELSAAVGGVRITLQ